MSNRDLSRYTTPRGSTPLSEAMSQLFRDAFTTPAGMGAPGPTTGLNLYETNDSYILQVLLPGVTPDQLDITARENVLTLQGTLALAVPEGARALVVGTGGGDFREQVQLPSDVDADGAAADYRDGVLTLTLPKAARAKVRTIKVGSAQNRASEGETQ